MTQNNGGAAFPFSPPVDETGRSAVGYPFPETGMTLRDWFAGQALNGAMSADTEFAYCADTMAKIAFAHADAMLAARDAK